MEYKKEIVLLIIILFLSLALINPFNVLMPTMMEMFIVAILVLSFSLFAGFFWMERGGDEREALHKMMADRMAFLAGAFVLIIGILSQSLRHGLDDWLVVALTSMIVVKVFGLIYSRRSH